MTFAFLQKLGPLRLAAIVFGVLLLFILIVEKPGRLSEAKTREGEPLLFPRLDVTRVTHARLTFPDRSAVALRRAETGWLADESPADPERVEALLSVIQNLQIQGVVSKNPVHQASYGVDEEGGVQIRLWKDSRQLVNFYSGKKAELDGQYLRLDEKDTVLLVRPALPPLDSFALPR